MFSWQGCKVAVTGATGFVGSHAASELRGCGANVIALTRATSDVRRLRALGIECVTTSFDDVAGLAAALRDREVVVHAAGAVGFDDDWATYTRANVVGTRNLLTAARLAGVRRVVHVSSIVAVGASVERCILDESAVWNLGSLRVPYVTTKRWAEEAALDANGNGLEVVVVNPASVIGPDDYSSSEFGLLCKRFWKRRIPVCFGGGNSYVDARDVARGIRLALEKGTAGERYLLTGANRLNHAFFADLAKAAQRTIPCFRLPVWMAQLVGLANDRLRRKEGQRAYLTSTQVELIGRYFFFSGAKAERELGFRPRPLMETLADAYAFWMTPTEQRSLAA